MAFPEDPFQVNMMKALMNTRGMQPGVPQPSVQQPQAPEVFTPERQANDAFMNSVNQMPVRNQPGMGRRIGAILAGIAGGPSATDAIMYAPYHRQMSEWGAKTNQLGEAAGRENQYNTQMRLGINDASRRDLGYAREDRLNEALDETKRNNAEKTRIAELNANTRAEVAKGGVLYKDELNGKAYMAYKDGSVKQLPVGALSKEDELDFINAGRLTVLRADQAGDQRLARLRAELESGLIRDRAAANMERDAAKPPTGSAAEKTLSPTELAKDKQNRIDEWLRTNPDKRNWIKVDPKTNTTIIEAPSGWFSSASPEDVKKAKEAVDFVDQGIRPASMGESGVATKTTPARTSAPSTSNKIRKQIPGSSKFAISTDGGKTWKAE